MWPEYAFKIPDQKKIRYISGSSGRKIRVYHTMDVRLDLEDLYAKPAINYPEKDS